jgi:4-amino-4-deoxy-L-arabinose transferase-like glycosyltransferase
MPNSVGDAVPTQETVPTDPRKWATWLGAVVVGLFSLAWFAWDLPAEPSFVDESAYTSQAYFTRLFAQRRFNDPAWLEYMAFDLPPLPKYVIGASLRLGGFPFRTSSDAALWYDNTKRTFYPTSSNAMTWARAPMVPIGALGCVALYGIGVLVSGPIAGTLAGLLLAINPLYRMHARRAMSDVPCETFMLLALFLALWAWMRWLHGKNWWIAWTGDLGAGMCAGLALLSKLSGSLALMVIAAWTVLAFFAPTSLSRKIGKALSAIVVPIVAALVFIALNPYMTAHPTKVLPTALAQIDRLSMLERVKLMYDVRLKVAGDQQALFAHNALFAPLDKIRVAAVQGFGRFGPFGPAHNDSTIRYDLAQDGGACLWLPLVLAGAIVSAVRGWSQQRSGLPPTLWTPLVYWVIALVVVTSYLPMAWDRYQLPIQAPSTLLASIGLVELTSRVRRTS